jgi:hypothetical protein
MSRWIRFFIVLAIGIAAGLFYAWKLNPVRIVDTSPDMLRQDYKADYVLMVAEAYHADGDITLAVERLALLSSVPASEIVTQAIAYASGESNTGLVYQPPDLALMRTLAEALQTLSPAPETP